MATDCRGPCCRGRLARPIRSPRASHSLDRRHRLHRVAHLAGAAGSRLRRGRRRQLLQQLAAGAGAAGASWAAARRVFERADVCDARRCDALFERHAHRRGGALRGAQGGRRIDAEAARLLRQQPRRPAHAVPQAMERHGCSTLVFSSSATVYGEPRDAADHRRRAAVGDQPLRQHQADGRDSCCATSARPTPHGASPACATSTRSARTRAAASAKTRAACPNNLMPYVAQVAVGRRAHAAGVRRRLRHARRHRRARLHPRRRPGRGPRRRAAPPARAARLAHRQPRHRPRPQRARSGARLRGGQRPRRCRYADRRRGAPATSPPAMPTRRWPQRLLGWRAPRDLRHACARTLALAEPQSATASQPDRASQHEHHQRPARHHGRRQRHAAVAAVARAAIPKQFLVLHGQRAACSSRPCSGCAALAGDGIAVARAAASSATRSTASWCSTSCARSASTPRRVLLEPVGPQHRAGDDAGRAAGAARAAATRCWS